MQEVIGSTPLSSTKKPQNEAFFYSTCHTELILRSFCMSFTVYILYSSQLDQFYIGHSQNVEKRLEGHNRQQSKSTKKANDWRIVYLEEYPTRATAMQRESEIKRKKSRKFIESIL